jgi:4-hydroxybenzoate polyprenyltransferase
VGQVARRKTTLGIRTRNEPHRIGPEYLSIEATVGTTPPKFRPKRRFRIVDAAIVLTAVLTAIAFWTRNIVFIFLLIPCAVFLIKHKAASKEERSRREVLATRSFAATLIIPIIVVLGLAVYFLITLVPEIIANWK